MTRGIPLLELIMAGFTKLEMDGDIIRHSCSQV